MNYKNLMIQHGGMIPFSVLTDSLDKKDRNKTIRRRKKKKSRTSRRPRQISINKKYNPDEYHSGTIIRHNRDIWQLKNNKWIKI